MSTDEQPPEQPPRSGLRNPAAAVRGLGIAALTLEAVVLLLAIQPIRVVGGDLSGLGIAVMVGLALLCLLLCGFLRHPFAWRVGLVLQALVLLSGLFQWALALLGLAFGGVWLYVLHVRRTILNT